jgi:hypothetical protein
VIPASLRRDSSWLALLLRHAGPGKGSAACVPDATSAAMTMCVKVGIACSKATMVPVYGFFFFWSVQMPLGPLQY